MVVVQVKKSIVVMIGHKLDLIHTKFIIVADNQSISTKDMLPYHLDTERSVLLCACQIRAGILSSVLGTKPMKERHNDPKESRIVRNLHGLPMRNPSRNQAG